MNSGKLQFKASGRNIEYNVLDLYAINNLKIRTGRDVLNIINK
jgi:hypothetical protein